MPDQIKCPKCGSEQITANKKGYSVGKAAAGVILTGGIGLIAGAHGSGKIVITCLACGERWKPGQTKQVQRGPVVADSKFPEWRSRFIETYESGDHKAAEEMYIRWYGSTTKIPFHERYNQFTRGDKSNRIIIVITIVVALIVIASMVF